MKTPPSWVSWNAPTAFADPIRESAPLWVRIVSLCDAVLAGFILVAAVDAGFESLAIAIPLGVLLALPYLWVAMLLRDRATAGTRGAAAAIAFPIAVVCLLMPGLYFPSGSPADDGARLGFLWLALVGAAHLALCVWAGRGASSGRARRDFTTGIGAIWGWSLFALAIASFGR